DFVYAVTEPTPMGAHDLILILDLCKKLEVPAKIILNRAVNEDFLINSERPAEAGCLRQTAIGGIGQNI
ncbi:hypothetical protein J7L85_05665, partial [candidate division WOR-3 bacterium]|nr:hypothetical protein [candidate division WOR-3 bacterium]